jgi:hypothetical protein
MVDFNAVGNSDVMASLCKVINRVRGGLGQG